MSITAQCHEEGTKSATPLVADAEMKPRVEKAWGQTPPPVKTRFILMLRVFLSLSLSQVLVYWGGGGTEEASVWKPTVSRGFLSI